MRKGRIKNIVQGLLQVKAQDLFHSKKWNQSAFELNFSKPFESVMYLFKPHHISNECSPACNI